MDNYKILAQLEPSSTPWTEAYFVPGQATVTVDSGATLVAPAVVSAKVQTLVTSIIVCGIAASTFSIALRADRVTHASVNIKNLETLFSEKPIAVNVTEVLSLGLTLGVDNTIWVYRGAGAVSFTIMGIEIT